MSETEAQKRAKKKYAEKIKQICVTVTPAIYDIMQDYCSQKGLTKREFLENAIQEYIDKH